MAYAGGYGWQALGEGLQGISQMLFRRQELTAEEKRQKAEQDRIEAEKRARQQAVDLSQPGATTLEAFIQNPANYQNAGKPMPANPTEADFRAASQETPYANLGAIGNAAMGNVPVQFKAPPPETLVLPNGQAVTTQDKAPSILPSGIVMDPRAARRAGEAETMRAVAFRQSLEPPPPKQPWERSPGEQQQQLDWMRRSGEAGRAPTRPQTQLPSQQAMNIIQQKHTTRDPNGNPTGYDVDWDQIVAEAKQLDQTGAVPASAPQPAKNPLVKSMEDMSAGFRAWSGQGGPPMLPGATRPTPGPAIAPTSRTPTSPMTAAPAVQPQPPAGGGLGPLPSVQPPPAAPTSPAQAPTAPVGQAHTPAEAKARALELQSQGKSRVEIEQILLREGYQIRPRGTQ